VTKAEKIRRGSKDEPVHWSNLPRRSISHRPTAEVCSAKDGPRFLGRFIMTNDRGMNE